MKIINQTIKTERLFLEVLTPDHANFLVNQLQNIELYQYIPNEPPQSLETLKKRYKTLCSDICLKDNEIWLNWVLKTRESSKYVGTLEVTIFKDLKASIAYMIFPEFQRKGYATEGCQAIISHLIGDYKIKLIDAFIDTRNKASISLVKKLEFSLLDEIKNADYFKGAASDEYHYRLITL